MKQPHEYKNFYLVFSMGMLIFSSSGCSTNGASNQSDPESRRADYPIASDVQTTLQRTIIPDTTASGLSSAELSNVSQYSRYGYGTWTYGPGLPSDPRTDLMSSGYTGAAVTKKTKLLNFFEITDIHTTDKESPAQLIYLQQLHPTSPASTSLYSPIMPYTTQVLDAAIQTVNALHKQNPFDFGISLGDTCNSTQYNELRWYIDVIDGKVISPSSGAHLGADTIDYQEPYKAAGLDKTIPWYQTIGNHDHFWMGSFPVTDFLRQACVSNSVIATGDVLADPGNITKPDYYMGVLNGATPYADIIDAGPAENFSSAPRVVADPNRRSLLRTEWMKEFFSTSSNPVGHGFNSVDANKGFACYSFVPKSKIPIKVIVLDDTQRDDDGSPDIHGHGFLDQARWNWLKKELADGDAAGQLMIIAGHVPIDVQPLNSELEWWVNPQNAVTLSGLITELQSHPNFIMWLAGHRHCNTVKAFPGPTPERGFWQVETSSLRDFPQQFRTFEIYLNSDYTISIVTTDVDPAVKDGTLAAKSRMYAIATQQIVDNEAIYQKTATLIDPVTQIASTLPDTSIKPMFPTGSYNAELFKQLSPAMKAKMMKLYPAP